MIRIDASGVLADALPHLRTLLAALDDADRARRANDAALAPRRRRGHRLVVLALEDLRRSERPSPAAAVELAELEPIPEPARLASGG